MTIRAFVLDGDGGDIAKWLREYAGATIVQHADEANLVVFVGGSDVTPSFYGEQNVDSYCDWQRDCFEQGIFERCKAASIPMLGICRGSQFLHVMMGGKMWQDVNNHAGVRHQILDLDTQHIIDDTCSTHHQMVRLAWVDGADAETTGFRLFATPPFQMATDYVSAEGMGSLVPVEGGGFAAPIPEVEGYTYSGVEASIMGIQGHPEWGGDDYATWAANKVAAWHEGLG